MSPSKLKLYQVISKLIIGKHVIQNILTIINKLRNPLHNTRLRNNVVQTSRQTDPSPPAATKAHVNYCDNLSYPVFYQCLLLQFLYNSNVLHKRKTIV